MTPDEEQVLRLLYETLRKRRRIAPGKLAAPTTAKLVEDASARPDTPKVDVEAALIALRRRGWVKREGEGWMLSEPGEEPARTVHEELSQRYFGEWMVRSEASPAYRTFCDSVYGTGLVQFNMVDALQLQAVMDALALQPTDEVLDVGCGIGTLSEHMAKTTRASVHGVDFARQAIERARERTAPLALSLRFDVEQLDGLRPAPASYDAVVAFDALYFADDLSALVARLLASLRPAGRFVTPYSAMTHDDQTAELLQMDCTPLAVAIRASGHTYKVTDFTNEDHAFWRRCLREVHQLKREFAAEGSQDLWRSRLRESEHVVERYETGKGARYLYVVSVPER